MLNLDSDSDDDLLTPTVAKMGSLISQVHMQARKADIKHPSSSRVTKDHDPKVKDKGRKNSPGESTVIKKQPEKKTSQPASFSKGTTDLLAEVDRLTQGPSRLFIKDHSASASSDSKRRHDKKTTRQKPPSRPKRGQKQAPKSPPKPIILSSDEECLDVSNNGIQSDISIVEPNSMEELCSLRIRFNSELLRFQVPQISKLSKIRMEIGEQFNIRADNLVILDEEDGSEMADNMSVGHIPFGKSLEVFERTIPTSQSKKLPPNCVRVIVQGCGGYRERLDVVIQRSTHVKQLVDDFIEKFKFQGKKFKLVFDGDRVSLDETPDSLDLEGGEMIDIVEII